MNSEKSKLPLKVVFDTNVYISAVLNAGKSREVLVTSLAREDIEVLISDSILSEIERVLISKLRRSYMDVINILTVIRENAIMIYPESKISVIKYDESDNRIIEFAISGKANYIVSGDQHHLLPLKEYQGIIIISPSDFTEILS